MLVDLVDLAPDQSKLSENRKFLQGGVREWWLNWLNLKLSSLAEEARANAG